MAVSLNKQQQQADSALITEEGVLNNPNIREVKQTLIKGYNPDAVNKGSVNIREYHTALIENTKPIFAISTNKMKDANGEVVDKKVVKQIFGAGWYLSVEEAAIREAILKDEKLLAMNQKIWDTMEQNGKRVMVAPAVAQGVRVVS